MCFLMIDEARKILNEEANEILNLSSKIDEKFQEAVNLLFNCCGKVVIIGIGKSGLIGRKIAATLASTGTPSFFVHAVEALHGDTGMMSEKDAVIMISHSGETEEVIKMMPFLKRKGIKIIAITGNPNSSLAKNSDIVLNTYVKKEAGELGLAPTTSSTVSLVLGDALAMCLLKKRNFKPEDYALLHPNGSLGKKLLLKVEDIMHSGNEVPLAKENSIMKEVIFEITSKAMGAVNITDSDGKIIGIITDGDLRRAIEKYGCNIFEKNVKDVMTKNPLIIEKNKLAAEALHLMEDRPSQIAVLPVIDSERRVVGMIRVHDIIKAGIT